MNNDYKIEKTRLPVVLTMLGGDTLSGDIFVQPYARYRPGRESAHDVFNSDEAFFPLAAADGQTTLIAKDQVAEVESEGSMDDDPANTVAARTAEVEIRLSSGVVRTGAVFLEVPLDRPRLLDFLNRFDRRFLTLHSPDGMRLINRRLVERVRQLD
jgi:hypothetical protein